MKWQTGNLLVILEMSHCWTFHAKTSHVYFHYVIACNVEKWYFDAWDRAYECQPSEIIRKVHLMIQYYHNYLPNGIQPLGWHAPVNFKPEIRN